MWLAILITLLTASAWAQERHNSLAIRGAIDDDAGPYYFIAQGDSSNAFAKASALAKAMDAQLSFDPGSRTLVFSSGLTTVRLAATSDIAEGLVKRPGVLTVNGASRDSPMGIIVDGVSYVPIHPVATALGWESAWHSAPRLITLDPPAPPVAPAPPRTETAVAATSGRGSIGGFRTGRHDGFTRVALDLGTAETYSIAVRDDTLVVTFGAASAPSASWAEDDPHVQRAFITELDGQPALVVQTRFPLAADGRGFRHGVTETGTLYVDFGPGLRGESVAQLVTERVDEPMALAPAPPPSRGTAQQFTVVLDAGHGGKFKGAQGYAAEEQVVLAVTLKLKALLEREGVNVILTRDRDVHLDEVYARDLAARAAFATPDRNLFVSIHANAATNSSAHGIETWVFGEPLDPSLIERAIRENGDGAEGEALTREALRAANDPATLVLRETQLNYSLRLADAVQSSLVSATGARDRGVRQNVFYVIKNASTPAILVELGFVSNPDEGRKLATASYQDLLAAALLDGIMEFLTNGGTVARR